MKNLFDYIYYKLTKLYFKIERAKGTTAAAGLAIMQTGILINLVYIPMRLFYSVALSVHYNKPFKYTAGVIGIILFGVNVKYYSGKYGKLRERYKDESFSALKTILVFIVILLPLIIFLFSAATIKQLK